MSVGEEFLHAKEEFKNSKDKFSAVGVELPSFINSAPKTNLQQVIKNKKPASNKFIPKNRKLRTNENNKKILSGISSITKTNKNLTETTTSIDKTMFIIGAGTLALAFALLTLKNNFKGFIGGIDESYGGSKGYQGTQKSSGHMSDAGVRELANQESCVLYTYDDQGPRKNGKPVPFNPGDTKRGTLTIGIGHTGSDVQPGKTITQEQAYNLFKSDLVAREAIVNKYVKVPITQNMFDALVMLVYNIGEGKFASSTLLKKLNAGDYKGAQAEFKVWNKAKNAKTGKIEEMAGLTKRRAKEAEIFGRDITADNKLKPVTPQTAQQGGKIGGHTIKSEVRLSQQAKDYLSQVQGNDTITSGMEGKHSGTAANPTSHYSGNKIDVGLGMKTEEQIKNIAIPYMRHPATVHVAFEGMSEAKSKKLVNEITSANPDIAKRINSGDLKIYHWAFKYSDGPHLDILISKDKLYNNAYNNTQKNTQQIKDNAQKQTKKPTSNKTPTQPTNTKNINSSGSGGNINNVAQNSFGSSHILDAMNNTKKRFF